ncbi:hypothetical protein DPQ33_17040 [Oceanidesulfovibrio indonesiensis]|uniref:Uncharacterized protein n=1 Tax=Oceanidesulfovibrio indonesiensis TaxID=54767 RepID=A0A7M3MAJ5_9BACT|nr:hypothetical protein [Oceanidesulfovibrio indonesiensis]TVM14712.1 hypothetical protein DPQ33_17040 [Oceanidesulfovibrio indonesiensis]
MVFIYCIFALVLCYGFFSFFFYRMPFTISWINDFFVKKEKIAPHERNRIIFAGGSSTLFGIHASLAERKFKVPTVNFGIASGLQTDYYFYRLKQIAQEGDLIILPLEYSFYCFDGTVSTIKEQYIRTFDRDYLYKLPPHKLARFAYNKTPVDLLRSVWDIYRHIRNHHNKMYEKINYNPNMTNANGDQTLNVGNEIFLRKYNNGYYQPVIIPGEGSYETAGLALINDFNNWCRENHVKALLSG